MLKPNHVYLVKSIEGEAIILDEFKLNGDLTDELRKFIQIRNIASTPAPLWGKLEAVHRHNKAQVYEPEPKRTPKARKPKTVGRRTKRGV